MAKNTEMTPKNSAAAEARAKAQAQLRAQERKTRVMIWAGVLIAIVLFGTLVAFIVGQSQAIEGVDRDSRPTKPTETNGIPVGTTGVVGVDLPDDVPVVRIYADYACPVCGQFEALVGDDIDALREAGLIRVEYHPIAILDSAQSNYSSRAANAVATVADGSPEHYLAYSHVLMLNQRSETGALWTNAELTAFAVEVGVPQEVANTIAAGKFRDWVAAATERALRVDGVLGTPTVMVDGVILDQRQVPYFQDGVLRAYLEELAAEG